jgi:hypothetical protein
MTIPVMARIYFPREEEMQREFTFTCGKDVIRCNKVIGTREYYVDTDFKTASVTFGGDEGATAEEWDISRKLYLKTRMNDIQVNASASVNTRKTAVCPAVHYIQYLSLSTSMTIQVYGVEIQ